MAFEGIDWKWMKRPFEGPWGLTSPYNWAEEVTKKWKLPKNIELHDATFRDGEQSTLGAPLQKQDYIDIACAISDWGVHRFEFMPATCNGLWKKDKCISSEETMKKISQLGTLEHLEFRGKGPSRNYRIKGAAGVVGFISPLSDHFCGSCNRLRLTADGQIRPCLFSNIKIDVKTPMRTGASDDDIDELFCQAIKVKPQRHILNENIASANHIISMSKIGG